VFMLTFGRELLEGILGWLAPADRDRARNLARRIRSRVGGYVAGVLVIAAIGGAVMTTALLLVGVPYVLPLGFAVAALGLIPFLGFLISALLVVTTTFLTAGPESALVIAAVYVFYQPVENNVLQPLVQRRTIDMNPLVIASAALVGTFVAGLWGTVLALPVAALVKVVLEDVREHRGLGAPAEASRQLALPLPPSRRRRLLPRRAPA
jgi:putative heme transporter